MDRKNFLNFLFSYLKLDSNKVQKYTRLSEIQAQPVETVLIQQGYLDEKTLSRAKTEFLQQKDVLNPNLLKKIEDLKESHQPSQKSPRNLNPTETEFRVPTSLNSNEKKQKLPSQSTSKEASALFEEMEAFMEEAASNTISPRLKREETIPLDHSNAKENLLSQNETAQLQNLVATDRYQILENLGEGGMGIVQLVQDQVLGREVALKKIKIKGKQFNQLSSTQQMMLWRLKKEAEITAILEHPNIVPLYDLQKKESGELYFTMRKVTGETLAHLLRKVKQGKNSFDENQLLAIFSKVCNAVSYAHSRGIIHRDLKPENMMLGEFGEVYVMDWGIAKKLGEEENLSDTNISEKAEWKTIGGIGTPGYMPSEQIENATNVNPQSDVYALGKILKQIYTLLSPMEELQKLIATTQKKTTPLKKDFVEFNIPTDIQAIIQKATKEAWQERYKTVQELLEDVQRYERNIRVFARSYSMTETIFKWGKRNKKAILLTSTVLFICASFIFYIFSIQKKAEQKRIFSLQQQKEKQVQKEWEKAKKEQFKVKKQHSLQEKLDPLLRALNHLNTALSLQNSIKMEQEKFMISEALIELACESKDFKLANFLVRDLKNLNSIEVSEQKRLAQKVEQTQTKILKQHKNRLKFWIKRLNSIELQGGETEDAIFEIAKMQEPEIHQQIIEIAQKGADYFINSKKRNERKDEYYLTMAKILSRLETPKAAFPIIAILEKMAQKFENGFPPTEIEYMVRIASGLKYLKIKGAIFPFERIRMQMGEDSIFCQKTKDTFKALFDVEDLEQLFQLNGKELYYQRAISKSYKGNYQGAIKDLTQHLNQNPNDFHAYYDRGKAKRKQKDYQGALNDYNKAIDLSPDFIWSYNERGLTKEALKDYQGAIKDFTKALTLNPKYSPSYNNRGLTKQQLGDFQGALEDYSKAISLNPQFAKAYFGRGNVKKNTGEYKEAIKDYNKAIQLNNHFISAYNNRGGVKEQLKDYSGAIADYNEVVQLSPQHATAYYNRANVKQKLKSYQEALQDYNITLELSPNFLEAYYKRGETKLKLNKITSAIKDYNYLIQHYRDTSLFFSLADLYSERGNAWQKFGQPQKALKDYNKALQLAPNSSNIYHNRGILKNFLKDYQGALKDYTKSIKLKPQIAHSYFTRGITKLNLNDIIGAIEDFNQAIFLNPSRFDFYHNRGNAKLMLNDYQAALKDFDKAILLNVNFQHSYFLRGFVRKNLKDYQKAIEDFNQAIYLNPNVAEIYFNRGEVKGVLKEHLGALQDYLKCIELDPSFLLAYLNSAALKLKLGKREEARKDFLLFLKQTNQTKSREMQHYRNNIFALFPELKSDITTKTPEEEIRFYLNEGIKKYKAGEEEKAKIDFEKFLERTQNMKSSQIEQYRQQIFKKYPALKKKFSAEK